MSQHLLYSIFTLALLSCSEKNETDQSEYQLLDRLRESPEQTKKICSETTNEAVLEQCKKIVRRPHLYKEKMIKHKRTGKYKSPLEAIDPSSTKCTENVVICRTKNALKAQTQELRVAECKSLNRAIWKNECLFETAERGLHKNKLSYSEAAELCSISGSLVYNCLQHLSIVLADRYKTIEDSKNGMREIEDHWSSRDVGQSKKMKTIFWMTFIEMYINNKTEIEHNIFTQTESDLHPHIWAALTKRILETSEQDNTLEERSTSLLDLYNGKKSIRIKRALSTIKPMNIKKPTPTFPEDYKSVQYLGEHKRVLGKTVKEEIEICYIMAAYTLQNHISLIEEAKNSPSNIVKDVAQKLK